MLIEINKNPSPRELRWFGLIVLAFGALISGLIYARTRGAVGASVPVGAAVLVALFYYAVPALRRPLYLGWMYACLPVGLVMSFVLLAAIYFLVFTPIGLLMRLVGRERVPRGFDRRATSYWIRRPAARPPASYFRQF
jgi:hypothetical protein